MIGRITAAFLAGALLISCAPEPLTEAEIAALPADKARWIGKFDGNWGGDCTGSLEVLSISGEKASVIYSWGFCGNSNKGSANRSADFDGETLKVNLWGSTTATYTFVDGNTIEGSYVRPRDGVTARAKFTRVEG